MEMQQTTPLTCFCFLRLSFFDSSMIFQFFRHQYPPEEKMYYFLLSPGQKYSIFICSHYYAYLGKALAAEQMLICYFQLILYESRIWTNQNAFRVRVFNSEAKEPIARSYRRLNGASVGTQGKGFHLQPEGLIFGESYSAVA